MTQPTNLPLNSLEFILRAIRYEYKNDNVAYEFSLDSGS